MYKQAGVGARACLCKWASIPAGIKQAGVRLAKEPTILGPMQRGRDLPIQTSQSPGP